ncbi:hypothetical protein AB834_03110 [PVC group bacterium (ex Bugula neritina AB1)]|nr:hypothetical protein AB834_03110 [PVC group bacterium (ex Bugula neritina AB1)]
MTNPSKKRFFIRPEDVRGEWVYLRGQEYHHAVRVLRISLEDILNLMDGEGCFYRVRVINISHDEVQCLILKRNSEQKEEKHQLSLAIALPKEKVMSFLMEKSVEMGIVNIIPFISERSQRTSDKAYLSKRFERWQKIIQGAGKQSGNFFISKLEKTMTFQDFASFLRESEYDKKVLLSPWAKSSFATFDSEMRSAKGHKRTLVLIGPEGGFTESEEKKLEDSGAQSYSCGTLLMKVETAMLFVATANHLWNMKDEKFS